MGELWHALSEEASNERNWGNVARKKQTKGKKCGVMKSNRRNADCKQSDMKNGRRRTKLKLHKLINAPRLRKEEAANDGTIFETEPALVPAARSNAFD